MEKLDLTRLNDLINTTGDIIMSDNFANVEDDVVGINKDFEDIYRGIGGTSESGVVAFIRKIVGGKEGFEFSSFEGKINMIFSRYDDVYSGITNSIEMFSNYNIGLQNEIENITKYIEDARGTELSDDEVVELRTIEVMLQNLILTKQRIEMRLDSAIKLEKTMASGRPIFQTLLSSAMLEVSGQRAIESSIKVLSTITGTINSLSNKLTEATSTTALIASRTRNEPILFIEGIRKNIETLQLTIGQIREEEKKVLLLK